MKNQVCEPWSWCTTRTILVLTRPRFTRIHPQSCTKSIIGTDPKSAGVWAGLRQQAQNGRFLEFWRVGANRGRYRVNSPPASAFRPLGSNNSPRTARVDHQLARFPSKKSCSHLTCVHTFKSWITCASRPRRGGGCSNIVRTVYIFRTLFERMHVQCTFMKKTKTVHT